MKLIHLFILFILIFTGCTQKRVIEINYGDKLILTKDKTLIKTDDDLEDIIVFDNASIEEDLKYKSKAEEFYLAIVYSPKLVSSYVNNTLDTALGYLSYRNSNYNIKTFECKDESVESLNICLQNVHNSGYTNVIALFTPLMVNNLEQLDTKNMQIYLPLVEKQSDPRFIYGSINYNDQIKSMMDYAYMNSTIIYQDNFLGNKLLKSHIEINPNIDYTLKLDNSNNDYKDLIENKEILNYSTVFMYTSNIKASLLLSQMNVYEKYPSLILSTQQNFKPDLFDLTQKQDRKNLLIFSAISDFNEILKDELEYFGADATFNWVDYSVLVGVNYLFDGNLSKLIKNEIIENEVIYETRIYEARKYGFVEIK